MNDQKELLSFVRDLLPYLYKLIWLVPGVLTIAGVVIFFGEGNATQAGAIILFGIGLYLILKFLLQFTEHQVKKKLK